jgi:hypothetical protein
LELLSDAREVYGCLVTTFCSSLFLWVCIFSFV